MLELKGVGEIHLRGRNLTVSGWDFEELDGLIVENGSKESRRSYSYWPFGLCPFLLFFEASQLAFARP